MPDNDEEAGLRAFALEVGAYAGASYPERPEWVMLDGRRCAVEDVLASWREEERIGFRVRLEGGRLLLVFYVPEHDLWYGNPIGTEPRPDPRRRDRA
jgi:hypothetical protein